MEDVICKVKSWVQVLLVLVQQPFVPLAPLTAVHMCGRDESFTQHHVGRRSAAAVCARVRESVDGHVHVHQLLPLAAVE